jgi:proteasome lid subunit RPN8/RPN11
MISRAAVDCIHRAAAAAHPQEACGLLLGRGAHVIHATIAANVASSPATRFEIDPAHLLAAHRAARGGGPVIIGYWHSHPTGMAWPSATDAAMADADGRLWAILGGGTLSLFRAVPDGDVLGRFVAVPWLPGVD